MFNSQEFPRKFLRISDEMGAVIRRFARRRVCVLCSHRKSVWCIAMVALFCVMLYAFLLCRVFSRSVWSVATVADSFVLSCGCSSKDGVSSLRCAGQSPYFLGDSIGLFTVPTGCNVNGAPFLVPGHSTSRIFHVKTDSDGLTKASVHLS